MKNITMIAAVGKNLELGKDNQLIWKIKEDMAFFKKQTIGKPIVMGRKTLESLPGLLPKRKHIVLTSQNIETYQDIVIVHSKEELLDFIKKYKEEVMIIGGASVYQELIEDAEKMYLTEIDAEEENADAYFPNFSKKDWDEETLSEYEEDDLSYKHKVYTRKR